MGNVLFLKLGLFFPPQKVQPTSHQHSRALPSRACRGVGVSEPGAHLPAAFPHWVGLVGLAAPASCLCSGAGLYSVGSSSFSGHEVMPYLYLKPSFSLEPQVDGDPTRVTIPQPLPQVLTGHSGSGTGGVLREGEVWLSLTWPLMEDGLWAWAHLQSGLKGR